MVGRDRQKLKKVMVVAAALAAALAVAGYLAFSEPPASMVQEEPYDAVNKALKESLAEQEILMSSAIHFKDPAAISKYCTLFSNGTKQSMVEYCTSTEVKDKEGNFLGNIHVVGTKDSPKVLMALMQVDPSMSKFDLVKTMYGEVIDTYVCQCWEDEMPGGFSSSSEWIEGLKQFHSSDTKPHSKSKQLFLHQKVLQLELTTNESGYLWTLLIYS